MAILSFSDKKIEEFYRTGKLPVKAGWSKVRKVALRKLDLIEYAEKLQDLKAPPSNHLEKLSGNLKGWHSIRINDQWRVIFKWAQKGPEKIRIVDYHK
jgi:toxin HigB-1